MAYTPELSHSQSATLRRIAWALEKPMTKAMGDIFDYLGHHLDPTKICTSCRDKTRCPDCLFNRQGDMHAQN
jgi:hypothetical protein